MMRSLTTSGSLWGLKCVSENSVTRIASNGRRGITQYDRWANHSELPSGRDRVECCTLELDTVEVPNPRDDGMTFRSDIPGLSRVLEYVDGQYVS